MKHQATNFKRKYNEIEIKDPNDRNPSKKGELIGRRTGKNLADKIANGNDFLMKNDFSNILEKGQQDMYDMYSSDSNSSSSKENASSSSESEAEESERENSSNAKNDSVNANKELENKTAKRINPTLISKETTTTTRIAVNNKMKNHYEEMNKLMALRLMDDPPVMEISDVEDKVSEKSESDSESEKAVTPAFAKNAIKPNANSILIPNKFVPQVNAKNNFKSGHKEMWSDKDKIKEESDDNFELDMSFKDNLKRDKNTKSKNVEDSLNLNNSNEDSKFINKNTKTNNNLKNNFPKNTITVKNKPLLDTNLSTIKKTNNTSNLFTDNELNKDKIDSEEEEEGEEEKDGVKPKVIVKANIKISNSNKNPSGDNKKKGEAISKEKEVKKFEYDDSPNNVYDNNESFIVDANNMNSSKETKKKETKVVANNVLKEANNKLNIKKEEKVEDVKQKPAKIQKVSSEKENKLTIVNDKKSQKKEELLTNPNRKTIKRTFSQYEQETISETQCMRILYDQMDKMEIKTIDIIKNDKKSFGESRKYSLRTRVPKLNHIAGDRLNYVVEWCYQAKTYVRVLKSIKTNAVEFKKYKDDLIMKPVNAPKKKLKKGLRRFTQEEDKESNEEEVAQDNLPEGFTDEEDDGDNIICIYAKSQKKEVKNMNVALKATVIEAVGSNHVVINSQKTRNLKPNDTFIIPPLAMYQISNFSDNSIRIKLNFSS